MRTIMILLILYLVTRVLLLGKSINFFMIKLLPKILNMKSHKIPTYLFYSILRQMFAFVKPYTN